jgi:hypothetical protein
MERRLVDREDIVRSGLLGGDHGAQHFCLAEVVLCLLGIVDGGALGLALEAVRKELGGG